jgi:hypothetical protein
MALYLRISICIPEIGEINTMWDLALRCTEIYVKILKRKTMNFVSA